MKKIMTFFVAIAFLSISASAQDILRNYTDCDFLVKVAYGDIGSCDWEGFITTTVPANSQVNIALPAGKEIVAAKGRYTSGSGCAFYVGQSCTPYDDTDAVNCGDACGDYSVSFNPSIGIKIYN